MKFTLIPVRLSFPPFLRFQLCKQKWFTAYMTLCSFISLSAVCIPGTPQHSSRRDIDTALEWRLLFDIDAPLWYYMQIDRDEGRGCLMCKSWFWGTANVQTTAFLLIAFPVESRNFIRQRMIASLYRICFRCHRLNHWRTWCTHNTE